jgi:hypothetical protein
MNAAIDSQVRFNTVSSYWNLTMSYAEFECRANIKYISNISEDWQAEVTAKGWKLI